MFHKILVPLDGSPLSEKALPPALELAKKFASEVILLQVIDPPYPITTVSGAAIDQVIKEIRTATYSEATEYLKSHVDTLSEGGYNVKTEILEGSPIAKYILDVARHQEIDLIVMSTHGRGGLDRWVFGSVADRVLRHANDPVLLIRASE